MNASESSEGFLGFLSGGQLRRHILVAQRILPRATQSFSTRTSGVGEGVVGELRFTCGWRTSYVWLENCGFLGKLFSQCS